MSFWMSVTISLMPPSPTKAVFIPAKSLYIPVGLPSASLGTPTATLSASSTVKGLPVSGFIAVPIKPFTVVINSFLRVCRSVRVARFAYIPVAVCGSLFPSV